MNRIRFAKQTGILFIILPILLNIPFVLLGMTFNYPDILREPAGDILAQFYSGGNILLLQWYAFGIIPLFLIFPFVMLKKVLQSDTAPYIGVATTIGVISIIAQVVGILRWVFVVPGLAGAYVDPASTQITRDATIVVFQAVHQYGGVLLGEHIGQITWVLWAVMVSISMFNSAHFPKWLGWFGIVSACVLVLAQLGLFATVIPDFPVVPEADFIGSVLLILWMIVLGVFLFRIKNLEPEQEDKNISSVSIESGSVSS